MPPPPIHSDVALILIIEGTDPRSRPWRHVGRYAAAVTIVESAADARRSLERQHPDVIVVDTDLSDIPTLELCRRLRAWPDVPIIATAQGDDAQLALFAAGADDVVTPDVSPRLFAARLEVQLRHVKQASLVNGEILTIGALRLDTASFEVEVHGRPLRLTAPLFTVLRVLMHNPGAVVTTGTLARALGHDVIDVDSHRNAVRVAITRLRARLGSGIGIPAIVTARSIGYRLVPTR